MVAIADNPFTQYLNVNILGELRIQGVLLTPTSNAPGDPLNAIQFNNPLGSFDGSADFLWDDTAKIFTVTGAANATTFNGATLTAAGVATNFLNETGSYSVPAASPGGADTQVQFNNAGVIDGSANFIFDGNQVGIGPSVPASIDGTLHVHTASAGVIGASSFADDLVVENSTDGGIAILTPDADLSTIEFGSPSRQTGGRVRWDFTNNEFLFGAGNTGADLVFQSGLASEKMRIKSAGNVGIGVSSPDASAILDTSSTTQGVLYPRLTSTQRDAVASPATGLEIYNTSTKRPEFFTGTVWTDALPNVFTVSSLQDILDIPGVVQTVNDIDVTPLGSFTLKPRGFVDLGANRIVCQGSTAEVIVIEGENQAIDIMISSHPDEMFLIEDCTVLVRWMNVFAVSATNGVFNVSNTAGNETTNSFQMFNTFINASIGGKFTDLATVSIFLPSFLGNTSDGFSFFGAFTRAAIQDIQFENYTGTAIDLGTATFDSIAIIASTDLPTVSNVFLSGAASSANLNAGGQGVVSNVRFEGIVDPTLVGITVQDLQWDFNNNPPLLNSFEAGFFNLTTTALTTINTQDVFEKIAGTTVAFGSNSRISQTASNEFQWDSLISRPVTIDARVSFTKTGSAEEYEITVFKDTGGGFVIIDADATGCAEIKTTTVQLSVLVADTPNTGDKYSIFVTSTTSSNDVTAVCMQIEIR